MLFDYDEKEIISPRVNAFISEHLPNERAKDAEEIIYKMIELNEMIHVGTSAEFRAIGYRQAVSDIYGIDYSVLSELCYDAHKMLNEWEEEESDE